MRIGLKLGTRQQWECRNEHGELLWVEDIHNLVVNEGLDDILDKYFKGSSYTAAWYVGLKGSGTIAVADTMASHAGWLEDTTYSNANRPTLTLGNVSGQSVDNSASKATFNINGTATLDGGFICTDNTKGGSIGILYGAADFASPHSVLTGYTLTLTATLTSAAA
jgi:hypothetical protein